jgi:hypothetical protein
MGRSTSPNSLSIWTRHITGFNFLTDSFTPQGCPYSIFGPSVTFGAGSYMAEINEAASLRNLTVLSAGAETVGYGGYITGAGHTPLATSYGLAADNVLEFEIVTPRGEILTINECQNQDLFWATRGGGGSTFGVITSTTVKAFPSTTYLVMDVFFGTLPYSEAFWDAMSWWVGQYKYLAPHRISSYGTIAPNTTVDGEQFGGFQGNFMLSVLSSENTTESLTAAITPLIEYVNTTWPGQFEISTNITIYAQFYDWWVVSAGPKYAGLEIVLGSRLLDAEALSDAGQVKTALQKAIPDQGTISPYLLGGPGVWDAVPRGGSDAVNPAWRSTLVHALLGVSWTPLNETEKAEQLNLLTNTYVKALVDLAPNSGAYINEADPFESDFQQVFWGNNYPKLLEIKRAVDPDDVFWCTPCVGNEGWKEVDNVLCPV